MLAAAPASAVDYFDEFARPDGQALGDGWIEKQPDAFSIGGAAAAKNAVATAYRDNIAYRPSSEDLLDAEASVEFELLSSAVGYPQVLVRVQANTAATPNVFDGYILYVSDSTGAAVLGRQRGSAFVTTLANIAFATPLNTTDRFRLRLRAVGADPVNLDGWVERWNGTGWEVIGQASVVDAAAERVATPGAVGFGGYIETSYRYDNFNRLDLQGGGGDNPLPLTAALAPDNVDEGSSGFTLTVTGSDFVPSAIVRWNGADRATTFVSATELQAAITAADVAAAGNAAVTVFNPAPGGGVSNAQNFTINFVPGNPVPAIAALTPDNAEEGSGAFLLSVNGSGFVADSTVRWNGADRATTFVSATELQAAITAADMQSAGDFAVTVFSPGPGGGLSNTETFTVNAPPGNPVPVLTALDPDSAPAGSGAFTLTVQGQDFINGSIVRWNGADRATTFVSATELQAAINAGDVATAGTANVTVFTPAPAGGSSAPQPFTIQLSGGIGNAQRLDSISPVSAQAGANGVELTLYGDGFTTNSSVQIGGIPVPTTFVSAQQLLADVDAGLLAVGLRSAVTVNTPGADNPLSLPQTLFILENGEQVYFDNFNRPDNPDLENGWTEKAPGAFSLGNGEVTGIETPASGFNHVITYRPPQEDAQNVEVGMEFVRTPGSTSLYPQVHARIQRDTVGEPGWLSSYTLFFDSYSSPGQLHITPIYNWQECYIATWDLTRPFVEGERYRLRFIVSGQDPVQMIGYMEWLNVDYWEVVASGTVLHDENSQPVPGGFCNSTGMIPPITYSGATGFAKWRNPSDRYDNFYTITTNAQSNPVPTGTTLTPDSTPEGGPAFTLVVEGTGFVPGATVRWNGSPRSTTWISTTEVRASISENDIANDGTASVTVENPPPGGGASNPLTFTIDEVTGNPAPILNTLSPDIVVVDSSGFTLSVGGFNFVPGAVVRWNGSDRNTTYISASELQADIPASDIDTPGTASVTVFNPAPGGGESATRTITILDPATDFFDDFNRPDSAALGDGWIEKQPAAYSVSGGLAVKEPVSTGYRDNLAYRNSVEDLRDVEASVEVRFYEIPVGFAQVAVRVQSDTVANSNAFDGYVVYVNNSTTQAILGRQRGSNFITALATLNLSQALNTTDTFRLRLRAVGAAPVQLDAWVERLDTAGWVAIGQASFTDGGAARIDGAGSVGFGGYVENSYSYDNFSRIFQDTP